MRTDLFDFHLPESLIASSPANPRDSSRMLVVDSRISDKAIRDFPSFLKPNDIVVFNDTRVIPARLLGKRGEAKIELLLHKKIIPAQAGIHIWSCFAKPAKRLKVGDIIIFADDFTGKVIQKLDTGELQIELDPGLRRDDKAIMQKLVTYGLMPLPPYIQKKLPDTHTDTHTNTYQTIYAQHDGSVAAPTAGLHFTAALLAALPCPRAHVTLHVGGGTFLPVKTDDTSAHVMHSEWAHISKETADSINTAKAKGGRVVAVGTTSLRTLESATDAQGKVQPFEGETNIFITPDYRFKCVDLLLTNFHLPRSTLFMLVSAFSGLEKMQAAYQHAIHEQYRFYSYGDACLLSKE